MTQEMHLLSLQILDKTMQIRCPATEVNDIQQSAQLLNTKMQEISSQGRTSGNERVAIMAAINAIYDLQKQQKQKDLYIESLSSRIRELQKQLDKLTSKAGI